MTILYYAKLWYALLYNTILLSTTLNTTISVNVYTHRVYIHLLLCLIQTVKRLIGNLFYSYVDHGESAVTVLLKSLYCIVLLYSTVYTSTIEVLILHSTII